MATFWPSTNPASFRPCSNAAARCSEPAAVVLRRNPITGTADRCARAASGHATTVLLKSLMNSRRLMASPAPRTKSGSKDYHIFGSRIVPFVAPKRDRNHVRFGSKGDIQQCSTHVRFTPKSGHRNSLAGRLLCAKSRHSAVRRNTSLFDHFVGAGEERWGNFDAERAGGYQVNDQFKLGRLNYR